jgi:hypothetical protein
MTVHLIRKYCKSSYSNLIQAHWKGEGLEIGDYSRANRSVPKNVDQFIS